MEWQTLAQAKFVSFGTYRRNGELVSTPVWLAPDGDDLVVTTEQSTGKIKRLRRDDRVVLQPCGRFGAVEPGSPTVHGRCVITGLQTEDAAAVRALRSKYGLQFSALLAVEAAMRRLQRKPGTRVILRISPVSD